MAEREDAIGSLQQMLQEALSDTELLRGLETEIGTMVSRLPYEAREGVEDAVLAAAMNRDYSALIAQVTPYLSARLMAERT